MTTLAAANTFQEAADSQQRSLLATEILQLPSYCAGCGIKLQADDPDRPGFYRVPKKLLESPAAEQEVEVEEEEGQLDEERLESNALASTSDSGNDLSAEARQGFNRLDSLIDDWLADEGDLKVAVRRLNIAAEDANDEQLRILCARCYSLSHYGQVKSAKAEAELPEFDLGKKVGRKIGLQRQRRAVVLCVVDAADFDGSLPRSALQGLFSNIEGYQVEQGQDDFRREGDKDVRFVLAVNKADLLPSQATQSRLEKWIRTRARQGGIPRPVAVHLVSALKGRAIEELLVGLHREVGPSGDVWVVGAQNAGKSSLINAMKRAVGHGNPKQELTTAALPGTTLGVVKVPGLMPPGCKMFDTPGVPHDFQLSSRLNPEEVKLLLPKRPLKPRTFRAAEGQTVLIGGVARIDVVRSPGATLYLTVWASADLNCHFGKTKGADERYARSVGTLLVPPLESSSGNSMGPLVPAAVRVEGASWRESSTDIAVAGVGWIGVGVNGPAEFMVWTPEGVAITTRAAVLPDYAKDLERPGFGNTGMKPKAKAAGKRKK